jgi:emp24/gp25L/p24 family/GOLD
VHDPNDKPILTEPKQRQGDYVFTAQHVGAYRFCLSNTASTFSTEKMVDMEIAVENESRSASLPQKPGTTPEQTSALEQVVSRVSGQMSTVGRMQKYFRTRENRNFSTVRSTEKRIFNFSLVEVGMMVGMAGVQVMVVRFFFQGARKGE